jgi:hypothetical protein
MTDLNPATDLRAAAGRLTLTGARILIAPRLTQPLAYLLTEVADCVDQEGGLVQDSTTEAAVDLAHAILAEQAPQDSRTPPHAPPDSPDDGQPAEHCGDPKPTGLLPRTECVLRPGHHGSHADHYGTRWWIYPEAIRHQPASDAGLPVQLDDALWDAIDIPGPAQPSREAQHQRVRRVVTEHLQMLATAEDIDLDTGQPDAPAGDTQHTAEMTTMFEGVARLLATSSRDWSQYAPDAWLYAVFVGWDCEDAHEHDELCNDGAAMREMAERHGWDEATVAKARRYRAAVRDTAMQQLRAEAAELQQLRTDAARYRQRAENAEARLQLARDALTDDGYFDRDEIGPDVAPRLIEWLAHHNGRIEHTEAALARVRALADDMRTWCSWRGMALHYSDAIREALDGPPDA